MRTTASCCPTTACTSWPTAWAATRPARSRAASPSSRSRRSTPTASAPSSSASDFKTLKADGGAQDVASFDEFRLRAAFEYGNAEIFKHASTNEAMTDMGTTIVGLAFCKKRVYIAHVGDSRAYRLRRDTLEQLTQDHSLANEFIRMNVLRPEDLPKFPYKNVIVRALGLQQDVIVDTAYRTAKPGDRYLLCSDGLTDLVDDAEIQDILVSTPGAEAAAEALVARALHYGGIDNITVLIADARP
jgi:serine/threonine protein phosphatase PrpC